MALNLPISINPSTLDRSVAGSSPESPLVSPHFGNSNDQVAKPLLFKEGNFAAALPSPLSPEIATKQRAFVYPPNSATTRPPPLKRPHHSIDPSPKVARIANSMFAKQPIKPLSGLDFKKTIFSAVSMEPKATAPQAQAVDLLGWYFLYFFRYFAVIQEVLF